MPDEVAQPLGSVFREGRFEDEGESGDRSFAGRGIALRGSEAVRKMDLCPSCGQPFFICVFAHISRVTRNTSYVGGGGITYPKCVAAAVWGPVRAIWPGVVRGVGERGEYGQKY